MRNLVLRFRWSVPPSFIFQKLIGNSLFSWRLFFSFFFWWFQYTRWLWFCQYLFLNFLFNFSNPFFLFMLSHFIIFYIQFTTISLVSKQSMKIIVLKGKIHKILPPKMLDSTRSGAFSHSNINRLCLKGIPSRYRNEIRLLIRSSGKQPDSPMPRRVFFGDLSPKPAPSIARLL